MFFQKRTLTDVTLLLMLAVCGVGLLLWSEAVSSAITQAATLCVQVLLPSLFPFFVLSSLLIRSGITQRLSRRFERLTHALFSLPGNFAPAILLGLVGGYPVGAKTVSDLYRQGACSKDDAVRALRFCNNAGPAFLIGAVGSGILRDKSLGILLYALHVIAALLIGILFADSKRRVMSNNFTSQFPNRQPLISGILQAVTDAFSSFCNVCAFVLFFSALMCILLQLPLLHSLPLVLKGFLCGMLELTSGTVMLAEATVSQRLHLSLLSFLAGWGGCSVQLQTVSFLREGGLPCRDYLRFKLLHGLLAGCLTFALYH